MFSPNQGVLSECPVIPPNADAWELTFCSLSSYWPNDPSTMGQFGPSSCQISVGQKTFLYHFLIITTTSSSVAVADKDNRRRERKLSNWMYGMGQWLQKVVHWPRKDQLRNRSAFSRGLMRIMVAMPFHEALPSRLFPRCCCCGGQRSGWTLANKGQLFPAPKYPNCRRLVEQHWFNWDVIRRETRVSDKLGCWFQIPNKRTFTFHFRTKAMAEWPNSPGIWFFIGN